jgi:hypothetical protein
MVHASNDLMGGPHIDPDHVLGYCRTMSVHLEEIGKPGEAKLWQSAFNPRTGFFCTITINHYLRYAIAVKNKMGIPLKASTSRRSTLDLDRTQRQNRQCAKQTPRTHTQLLGLYRTP